MTSSEYDGWQKIQECEKMARKISDATVRLLDLYRDEIGLKLPIDGGLDCVSPFEILQFFTSLEASLSMDQDEWSDVDLQLLEDVSNAVDEFNFPDGESIDIDDLNLRLMDSEWFRYHLCIKTRDCIGLYGVHITSQSKKFDFAF